MAPRYLWFRGGDVAVDAASGAVMLSPRGHAAPTVVSPTRPPTAGLQLPAPLAAAPHAAYSLGGGRPLGLREGGGGAPSLDAVRTAVHAARATELARYAAYGEHAEVKEALQAATMWNYIYTPAEYGPFLPVSRAWNFVKGNVNLDWAYVIFDWDNIFASYMTSLDPRAKEIAYSNYIQVSEQVTYSLTYLLRKSNPNPNPNHNPNPNPNPTPSLPNYIQVVRSRTARGMVPNYSAGGTKSVDRTEPPIGAKVLLEMHGKYGDGWLVELLFDDLLRWSDWF